MITGGAMDDNPFGQIPNPGEGKRGEQGHLGYLLRQASAAVRLAIERGLEDLEVTHPQFLVMTMVEAYPGVSSAEVARLTMLTPQTICLIVANLEKAGRLTKIASAAHGRIQRMELTEAGRSLLATCKLRVRTIEEALTATIPPDLEPILRRWLVAVATADLAAPAAAVGQAASENAVAAAASRR